MAGSPLLSDLRYRGRLTPLGTASSKRRPIGSVRAQRSGAESDQSDSGFDEIKTTGTEDITVPAGTEVFVHDNEPVEVIP